MVVHKKLRSKRLAPVLIKEITRRCNLLGVFQAVYTGGVVLPKPVSTCRYFHRAIDWVKLHDVGFSPLPPNSKPQYQVRKYALPDHTATKGLREMEAKDIDAVLSLLKRFLERSDMAPMFTREEVDHWLLHKKDAPGEQVIWSYVVEVCFLSIPTVYCTNRIRILLRRRSRTSSPSTSSNHLSSTTTSTRTSAQPTCSITPLNTPSYLLPRNPIFQRDSTN